jgi:glc operon protein GlcG
MQTSGVEATNRIGERDMRTKPCLTLDDVHKMVAAARKAGAKKKLEPTVAIVDAGGHLLYLERPDTNGVNTADMSTLKARTAALRERPSAAFAKRVKERPGFLGVPNCLGVEGGIPLIYKGECIGGIGVSGIAEDDEPVAIAGAKAFGTEKPAR